LRVPVGGRKTCTGILGEFADGAISILMDDKLVLSIDIANVEKARLVPSL
jgi:ribosome maturation factor RimP